MTTLTIKVKDDKTLKLIHDLEALDLIQIISDAVPKPLKLSSLLKGCISAEQADKKHAEVDQMRKEFNRNTY